MAVTSPNNRKDYDASGGQVTFPYDFLIFDQTHLKVYQNTVLKTLTTHYTVTGVGNPAGGNVVLVTGATAGDDITILRDVPLTQGVDLQDASKFPAETIEGALDRLTMICQQVTEKIGRAATFAVTSLLAAPILPDGVIGKLLRWKTTTELENVDVTGSGVISVPVSEAQGGTGQTTYSAARNAMTVGHQLDQDPATTTGLTWGYRAGINPVTGAVIAASTLALTDAATNYVELDATLGTLAKNTVGFTAGKIPIRKLVTSGGVITTSTDNRPQVGGAGGGGNPIQTQVFGA